MGSYDQCDPAMLELFRAEMDTHVPVLSEGLLALEKGQDDVKVLEAMMRAAHSIKGAARIVGIDAAGRLAHAMEDCFSAAQGRKIDLGPEAVDVLLHAVDALQKICSPDADAALPESSVVSLINRMAEIRDGRTPSTPIPAKSESVVARVLAEHAAISALTKDQRVSFPALLDDAAAQSLWSELSEALRQPPSRLLLDFAEVQHLSAMALALLASFARETDRAEAALVVVTEGISTEVAGLFRATGLAHTYMR